MKNKLIKEIGLLLLVINNSLFIISLSISFVLIFRPFYYYHINYLDLTSETGYTYNEIKESYDNVIDYLVLDKPFKTGKLNYSSSGYDHFKDCKILFKINFIILGLSLFIIFLKNMYLKKLKVFKHNISFWSSILNIMLFFLLFTIYKIISFSKFFELFHNIFFLGQDNWLLDSNTDEIIKILPNEYFINCAILISLMVTVISITLITRDIRVHKLEKT